MPSGRTTRTLIRTWSSTIWIRRRLRSRAEHARHPGTSAPGPAARIGARWNDDDAAESRRGRRPAHRQPRDPGSRPGVALLVLSGSTATTGNPRPQPRVSADVPPDDPASTATKTPAATHANASRSLLVAGPGPWGPRRPLAFPPTRRRAPAGRGASRAHFVTAGGSRAMARPTTAPTRVRVPGPDVWPRACDHRERHAHEAVALEGEAARGQLIQRDAEAVDVAPVIGSLAEELLRAPCRRGFHRSAAPARQATGGKRQVYWRGGAAFSEPEVQNLHLASVWRSRWRA